MIPHDRYIATYENHKETGLEKKSHLGISRNVPKRKQESPSSNPWTIRAALDLILMRKLADWRSSPFERVSKTCGFFLKPDFSVKVFANRNMTISKANPWNRVSE